MGSPCGQYDTFACHPLYDEAFKLTSVLTRAITCEAHRKTKYLLEKGCDSNMPAGRNRVRPLMVACYVSSDRKRMAILRCLMKHGADPTLGDVYGRNSMMYACALGLRDETELMVKDCDYDLNATDMYGDTPLHMCAKAGSTQVLAVLLGEMLKHRMDISLQNHSFHSPLSLAILNGNNECARILYNAGGSPRYLDPQLEGSSRAQGIRCKGNAGVKIAWNNVTEGVWQGGPQAAASSCKQRDLGRPEPNSGVSTFGASLRRQEFIPKLFTRVQVESASDICKAHSGVRSSRALPPREEPPSRSISTVKHLDSQVKGHLEKPAKELDICTPDHSIEQHLDLQGSRCSEESALDKETSICSRPANSMDCINAILSSPVYKTRLASSFSRPSKTIVHVDSQWLATINTYNLLKTATLEEYVSLPKVHSVHATARLRSSGNSSSSSASSSQSHLFRSKVLKHMTASPHLFRAPLKEVADYSY